MTKDNKTLKWAIGIFLGLAITALASMNALGVFQGEIKQNVVHNHEAIQEMKPEVTKNTEHRIKFEEKVNNMGKNIDLILKEVSK